MSLCGRAFREGAGRAWWWEGRWWLHRSGDALGRGGPLRRASLEHHTGLLPPGVGRQMAAAASAIAAGGQECHSCSWITPKPSWFPARAAGINPGRGKCETGLRVRRATEAGGPWGGVGEGSPASSPSAAISAGKALSLCRGCTAQPPRNSAGKLCWGSPAAAT